MAITFPNTFSDGTNQVGSGKAVMENLETLKAVLDPLFGTSAGWTASVERALSPTKYLVSATRPSFVYVQIVPQANTAIGGVAFYISGTVLSNDIVPPYSGQPKETYGPFFVPAGKEWELGHSPPDPAAVFSQYLIL